MRRLYCYNRGPIPMPVAPPPAPSRDGPFARVLALPDVIVMTVVAVVSPRWITRSAAAGAPAVTWWVLAALVFAWPLAVAVRTLARRYPEQGGLYPWTRRAFGPLHGFVCGWCYWVSNLFYFPSVLLFAAANALGAFGPAAAALADNRGYTAAFVLGTLWLLTGLNLLGLRAGRAMQRLGAAGLWLPVALLVSAGGLAVATQGPATSFAPAEIVPHASAAPSLGLFSSLCFAFVGFEVTAFVGQEVVDARRTIPAGVALAFGLVTAYYLVTSASILAVLPVGAFSERTGIAEAVDLVAAHVGLPPLGRVTAPLLALGLLATVHSWIAGSARLPFAIGLDAAMPVALARLHPRYRTPHVALLVQALLASLVFLVSLFLTLAGTRTTVMEAYDILVGLTIVANFVPYLYLFAALLRLEAAPSRSFAGDADAPGRARRGVTAAAGLLGLAATGVALVLTFLPPPGTTNVVNYELNLALQTAAVLAAGFGVFAWARRVRLGARPAVIP
jgi:amino acid transporter